jgi:signal transduction histidine kinase
MVRPSTVSAVAAGDDTSELDRRLAEVDALRRRVLNVIPHALRTPITTFRGLAEALVHATDDEIRNEIGPALRRLAAQAEHLLDDMLIAAGYSTALPTGPDVPTALAMTARTVWTELGGHEAGPFVVEGDEDVAALAPAGSVFKILVHVLDNARKYGDETGTTLRLTREGEHVVIDVDSPGKDPGDLPMLFEPFYRGEAAVMRSSGLGVGLTVARSLATQAGGDLTLAALDGGGLRTRVRLRAAAP